ncbi:MAG: hypothetical protein HKN27_07320 [Silicimonas sp.]|nr:hypothetical protein [Silicimonas sp.]
MSAENRDILYDLNAFWKPHDEADARFENWMKRSLSLTDRDMFVSDDTVDGYVISQPATPLHIPPAHDLLSAADSALKVRWREACIVVCPAAWTSKIALLEGAGYATAIVWYIKR